MQGVHLRKYGVEATIDFEVYEVDGVDLRVDWVPAQADCEIMKNGGASTLCDNTATDEGSTYSIVLTATEMQFARGVLKIVDAATKVFLDKVIVIETYGHASAQHAFDLDTALADATVGTCTTNTDMVGTDGANTTVPDAAGTAPTAAEIKTAIEAGGSTLAQLLEDTGTTLDTLIKDVPTVAEFEARSDVAGTAATPAEVNTQVLDVLNTDTFAEPGQEAPAATTTLVNKIGYLYKFLRNKVTNDGTNIKVYNDAGAVVDQKNTVSESEGTVTRGEFGTGP